jgi:hypothetical protein
VPKKSLGTYLLPMRILLLSSLLVVSTCFVAPRQVVQEPIPPGWERVDAEGYFTFYLPPTMKLLTTERCEECAWGSTYADEHIRLLAEYTSWNEGYAAAYLAKQPEYETQTIEVAGKTTRVESWRTSEFDGFAYIVEARFFGGNQKLLARLSTLCKSQPDVQTAKRIFSTVTSFKS